ncbi:retrovirus-related pol polyprotein from transposon TNT 1-94 [Tanacetum coccineum]
MRVFRELLKLRIRGVNGSTSSQVQGTAKSSSSTSLRLFVLDFKCPPLLVLLSDDGDSLSLHLFTLRNRSSSRDRSLYLVLVPRDNIPGAPSYSAGHSTPPSYCAGHSTPPSYSSGPSTPPSYSQGSSRNRKCSNCKHLRGKISVLKNLKQASIALKQGKSMIIAGLAESKKDHAIELLAKLEVGIYSTSFEIKEVKEAHESDVRHLEGLVHDVVKLGLIATACYTQNRSIVRFRHGKTPYELLHEKLPDLSFFYVFGALYYPTNDSENLGKLQPKADIGIFIGYAPTKKAFRVYNQRTRRIIKTIHVDFDELTAMASEHSSSGPALHKMNPTTISLGLVPNPPPLTPFVPRSRSDWDLLFQPMFDELLTPTPSVDHPVPKVIAPIGSN